MKRKFDLKNFFEPEIGKTIVVYSLFFITLILSISWINPPPKTLRVVEISLFKVLIPTRFRLESVALMLSWVLYWYLLSCPIVWGYKKLKKLD